MFEDILIGLDGSALAEKAIPVARSLARGRLTFLRVVQNSSELAEEEEHLREAARRNDAHLRIVVASDVPGAIASELAREPNTVAVLATHGRSAWSEAVMGSVALQVLREAPRPVVLYHPRAEKSFHDRIEMVAAVIDGSAFAEKILPHAVRAAQSLSARLLLLQALPSELIAAPGARADVVEAAYLHRHAADLKARHGIDAEWDVLHGDAGPAICRFIQDMPGTLLAMTTHARPPAERVIMGSVAAHCIRHSGAPLLVYWPKAPQA